MKFKPDYISCTYGAGGTNVGKNLDVCKLITECGQRDRSGHTFYLHRDIPGKAVKEQLQNYLDNGSEPYAGAARVTCPTAGPGTNGDFAYATDLVAYVRREFGDQFEIAVAGSPEGTYRLPQPWKPISHT